MYKKITHTITEEHFGHPMATEIKKMVDTTKKSLPGYKKPAPKMASVMSQTALKSTISDAITNYVTQLTAVTNDIFSGDDIALHADEAEFFKNIDIVGNMFKSYYDVEFGEKVNQAMRAIGLITLGVAKNLKNNLDIKDWTNRYNWAATNDMISMFNSYNNSWTYPVLQDALGQLTSNLVAQAKARDNKDSSGEMIAVGKLKTAAANFANIVTTGLAAQYPELFTA